MLAGGRELSLTVSIGAVLTERGTASVSEILRTVTVAATRARERGGARAELATHGMRRRLLHAAEIEQGLRRALTDGELRLHYQPILDLSTAARSSPSRRSCAGSTPSTACSSPRSSSPPPTPPGSPSRSARRS